MTDLSPPPVKRSRSAKEIACEIADACDSEAATPIRCSKRLRAAAEAATAHDSEKNAARDSGAGAAEPEDPDIVALKKCAAIQDSAALAMIRALGKMTTKQLRWLVCHYLDNKNSPYAEETREAVYKLPRAKCELLAKELGRPSKTYNKPSTLKNADEGLFAARSINKGSIVAVAFDTSITVPISLGDDGKDESVRMYAESEVVSRRGAVTPHADLNAINDPCASIQQLRWWGINGFVAAYRTTKADKSSTNVIPFIHTAKGEYMAGEDTPNPSDDKELFVVMRASRDIVKDEEIFSAYDLPYWMAHIFANDLPDTLPAYVVFDSIMTLWNATPESHEFDALWASKRRNWHYSDFGDTVDFKTASIANFVGTVGYLPRAAISPTSTADLVNVETNTVVMDAPDIDKFAVYTAYPAGLHEFADVVLMSTTNMCDDFGYHVHPRYEAVKMLCGLGGLVQLACILVKGGGEGTELDLCHHANAVSKLTYSLGEYVTMYYGDILPPATKHDIHYYLNTRPDLFEGNTEFILKLNAPAVIAMRFLSHAHICHIDADTK